MKKIMPWAFVGLFFISLASCGSSKVKCDAYGVVDSQPEQNELAQQ